MEVDSENVRLLARQNFEETKMLIAKLKRSKPKQLDDVVHELHDKISDHFDCLSCANCCKSISPIVTDKDIEKMAKKLRMKDSDFVSHYLHIDEDHHYVFNDTPCPFLLPDNYCAIYEYRPKACREYPHTDRRRFYQILDLTMLNRDLCPIVYLVVEGLKPKFK